MDFKELAQTKGKIMGIDFGDTRTGLAVSDISRFLASGIGFIRVGGLQKTAEECARLATEHGVCAFVIGLPANMNGSEGHRAERVREFATILENVSSLPYVFMDERLTTVAASRFLNETNTRGAKRKSVIDTLSAQIILQNSLDKLKYVVESH